MLKGERDQREEEGMQAGKIKWGGSNRESENSATEIIPRLLSDSSNNSLTELTEAPVGSLFCRPPRHSCSNWKMCCS